MRISTIVAINSCIAAMGAVPVAAGGMAEPIERAPVEIIEDTAGSMGSSSGLLVPLILLALIAAASSGGSDNAIKK